MVTRPDPGEAYRAAWTYFAQNLLPKLSREEAYKIELETTRASEVLDKNRIELFSYPNVVGVAVSLKYLGRERTVIQQPCLAVFVQRKLSENDLRGRFVPKDIEGIPTDVIEAGTPVLHQYTSRVRPAEPGYSISHLRVTGGTLGCLVRDRKDERLCILSNCHVMANDGVCRQHDPIVQPGTLFGGRDPHDTIGRLKRWIDIVPGINSADAAIAEVADQGNVTSRIAGGVGTPSGVWRVDRAGLIVQKVGSTSQHTLGVVAGFNGTVGPFQYKKAANVMFERTIITTGMSEPGDSGCVLLDVNKYAVGLLFGGLQYGGSYVASWYNDIAEVLLRLDVELVTT